MNTLLTRDELAALTGRKSAKAQRAWLVSSGWPHVLGADGFPRVARAVFDRHLGIPSVRPRQVDAGPRLDLVR